MTNKPIEPTNTEIQEAHDFDCHDPRMGRFFKAHTHRGIVLRRLAEAEANLSDMSQLCADYKAQAEKAQARLDAASQLLDFEFDLCFCFATSVCMFCKIKAALKGDKA